jgi:hypothetical protein
MTFPKTQQWTATRLAAFIRDLDEFDYWASALAGGHAAHCDTDNATREFSLSMAIDPEKSGWFWPQDLQREYRTMLIRLGLLPGAGG